MAAALQTSMASPAAASSLLGIEVERAPVVTTGETIELSVVAAGGGAGAAAGSACGAVLLLAAGAYLARRYRQQKRSDVAEAQVCVKMEKTLEKTLAVGDEAAEVADAGDVELDEGEALPSPSTVGLAADEKV